MRSIFRVPKNSEKRARLPILILFFRKKYSKGLIDNFSRYFSVSVNVQRRVEKSTDSSPNDESEYERCQRIINRAFSPNPPHTEFIPDPNVKHEQSLIQMVTPEIPTSPEKQCEKCQKIINQIFGEDNAGDKKREIVDPVCIPLTELQATTDKQHVETLAQKIEIIDETPLVEAAAKPKIEGFNVHPKVLGSRRKRKTSDKIPILSYSTDKPIHGRRKGSSRKDITSLDELAKRCLDSPSGQIDERLLKEMEQLGVPPSTRKGSRRTASDAGIVQPEIMRKPRRPVEKTEIDFLSIMKRLNELERLNDNLPPPFELIPVKANSINLSSSCEVEDNTLYVERIQPYHLTDQIKCQLEDTLTEEDLSSSAIENSDERPPQQLLGHMSAACMSNKSDMMTDKTNEIEHLVITQERILDKNWNKSSAVESSDESRHEEPGTAIRNCKYEEISLSELQQMEKEYETIPRENLAKTNLLSEMVDPNDISPQKEPSSFIKECKEIETLRNLLATRLEHLTSSSVKSQKFQEYVTEFTKTSAPFINYESENQQGIETLKMERIKPCHLKDDPNIMSKETSPHTEPGILIRGTTTNEPMKELVGKNASFRGYSPTQEYLTAHQLFEQISCISRETEPGTMDDYQEIDYIKPEKATPSQLLDSVGVVCKDDPLSKQNNLVPNNKIQNIVTKQSDLNQVILDAHDRNISDNEPQDYVYTNLIEHHNFDVKQLQNTLLSSIETSRRALTEKETDKPVIAVDTGRLDSPVGQEQMAESNLLVSPVKRKWSQDQLTDHNMLVSPSDREPVFQKIDESNSVPPQTLLNPLLDKGTVANPAAEDVNANDDVSATTIPKEHPQKPLTLSEMLKRVRERNRMELCKEFVELKLQNTQVDPVVGECGKKTPPCPPPAPICPPPPKPPCPPPKPPCPKPCQPKCPPTCPPQPCPSDKPKCPPPKKSPCDKFKKCKCSSVNIQDALSLLFYLGPQFHIPHKSMLPIIACAMNLNIGNDTKTEAMERVFTKLQDVCSIVLCSSFRGDIDALESVVAGIEGTNYARTYDPWSPIPSWPIPVKEEKRKLVCPKEGCKVKPPKLNAPCREINPCANLPRHNKFTMIDFIMQKLGKKVVSDVGEF